MLSELGKHGCDVLDYARNWRSALAFGVSTGSGPLNAGEPGLGPLNSLRVLPVRPHGEECLQRALSSGSPQLQAHGAVLLGAQGVPAACH